MPGLKFSGAAAILIPAAAPGPEFEPDGTNHIGKEYPMLSMIRSKMLRLLLLPGLSLLALIACGGNAAPSGPAQELSSPHPGLKVPTPTAVIFGGPHQGPIGDVPASVEEQIFTSRVIVRASLLSAAAKTETVPSSAGVAPTYRAVQELRFNVHEYLKGSGPSVAVVVVRSDHTYLTEAEAQRVADKSVSRRNTAWDGRQGALFLQSLHPSYNPAGAETALGQASTPAFKFTVSNYGQSEWDYSVDTVSRSWLPAEEAANATGHSSAAASVMFITDGAKLPHPTISLAGLRSKIAASEAEIKAGAGIPGYLECLHGRFIRERHFRKKPYVNPQLKATIDSGHAAGLELYRDEDKNRGTEYHNYWLAGPDKDLFKASVIDKDDDPWNGYFNTLSTARPLPGGVYKVLYNKQHYSRIPCNFKPDDTYDEWTVTVTAPPGTLHEAFFDPAALTGGGVGFSGSAGVLSPSGFSVGGTATTIQGLAWQNGSVSLTLQQYVSLDGYSLDFIGLDGLVLLRLDAGSATVDGAQGTLTWTAAERPWHEGDILMLRIRERDTANIPTPTPAPTPAATPVAIPTPTPELLNSYMPESAVSPNLEEQIFNSSIIVRASLLSVTAATETVPSDEGVAATYRALQELRFNVHEYLKGIGQKEVVVIVRDYHTYLTDAEALKAASESVAWRNTAWDGRQGVLFLETPWLPYTPNSGAPGATVQTATEHYEFTLSYVHLPIWWDYTIDTLSRAWLPAGTAGMAEGQSEDANSIMFITDGEKPSSSLISLAKLRTKVTEFEVMMKAGESIEGFNRCIRGRILYERIRRVRPGIPRKKSATLPSGAAIGAEIYRDTDDEEKYHNYWLAGPDKELFQASVIDNDSDSSNGNYNTLSTARPLPDGTYNVLYNWQHYKDIPCNFKPDDIYGDWTITVTAPPGTLHEAFFDPAALTGGSVGFSGASGVLKPAGFAVGSAATTIQGLAWRNGSVSLTLQSYVSLDGYSLDFIGLDGMMVLSLDAGSATVDGAQGTLTWPVAHQPWKASDKLMLRIRQGRAENLPTPTPTPLR